MFSANLGYQPVAQERMRGLRKRQLKVNTE